MLKYLYDFYSNWFSRKQFYYFNKLLFTLSVRGLGLLNHKNQKVSGEAYLINKLLKEINPDMILDIGANVGNYTKLLANNYAEGSRILSFEPHPKTFEILENNLDDEGYRSIELYNIGFGSENKFIDIYDYKAKDGSSHASIYKNVISDIHKCKDVVKHKIEIKTLDSFCAEYDINQIDFLKIDTEGNEYEVLQGASELIQNRKIKIIHFEFNEMNVISRYFFKDFFDYLVDYDIYRLLQNGLIPIKNYSPLSCELFAFQNIVAIKKNALNKKDI